MEIGNKKYLSVLAFLPVVMAGLLGSGPAHADTISITTNQITYTTTGRTWYPKLGADAISEIVVYEHEPVVDGVILPSDIYYQRLNSDGSPSGSPVLVSVSSATDDDSPDISGNFIVYVASDGAYVNDGRVAVYDIATQQTTFIHSEAVPMRGPVRIYGDTVVWLEDPIAFPDRQELKYYNLTWLAGTPPVTLAGPTPYIRTINIGDRFVVWVEYVLYGSSYRHDILAYDRLTDAHITVATALDGEIVPSTSGDWITWAYFDSTTINETRTVMAWNPITDDSRTIEIFPSTHIMGGVDGGPFPSIDGDFITYLREYIGTAKRDLKLYRISDNSIFTVVNDVLYGRPDIFGDKVAYKNLSGSDTVIYVSSFSIASSNSTPTGSPVVVAPEDTTTGGSPVTITFNEVTGAGETTLTTSENGTPPPAGFRLGNPPTYYEISTTATFIPPLMICIDYSGISYGNESALKLMHNEDTDGDEIGDGWVDATCTSGVDGCPDPNPDTVNNVLCGIVNSFSEFAIFKPDSPLIGLYRFNGNGNDDSGYGNHGTVFGGASYTSDKDGTPNGAIVVDGVDDYVELPNEGTFDLDEMTLMATVKVPDYLKENWIISKGTYFGNYTLRILDGQAAWPGYASYVHQLSAGNWSSKASNSAVPANDFFNIAVTLSATEFNAYINGELVRTVPTPPSPLLNDEPVIIGAGRYSGVTDFFKGVIDEVRIYNVALSAADIRDLYNAAPVADAGPDQVITLLNSTVYLDGTQSWDPEGDPITYSWMMTSRPAGSVASLSDSTLAEPTFITDVLGDYLIELVVSDPWAASVSDSVVVSFNNVKPVANAGSNQGVGIGDTISLDGSGSSDANGDPLTYLWTITSMPAGSGASLSDPSDVNPTFTVDVAGTYVVSLVVNDSFVNSDPDNVIIIAVNLANEVVNSLNAVVVIVNCMEPEQFKNRKMAKPLTNKILAVIEQVELEVYQGAIEKLENDVMPKMDGYLNGSPDKNDWIVVYSDSCGAFQMMSELTKNARDTLKTVINNMK